METTIQNKQEINPEILKSLIIDGDISKMNTTQRVEYFTRFCQALGLNPLTQPFQIIKFQGKEKLYATKDCTEQLRKIHGVSITDVTAQKIEGIYVVTAKAQDKNGKTDAATGAVPIDGVKGNDLANALMKAETKAKRRVTLSICGLGMLDESELDTMNGWQKQDLAGVDIDSGPATNDQVNMINSLLETARLSEKQSKQLGEKMGNGMTVAEAIKAISFLRDHQKEVRAMEGNLLDTEIVEEQRKLQRNFKKQLDNLNS